MSFFFTKFESHALLHAVGQCEYDAQHRHYCFYIDSFRHSGCTEGSLSEETQEHLQTCSRKSHHSAT